ncbi:MAG TPA: Crp/Fnr family transcriptional regulator [Bacteroidales bacterium]
MKVINDISDCKSCVYRFLLFDGLSEAEYAKVNHKRLEYKFTKGELIRKEGDEVNSFLYVRSGLVKLFKTDSNGKDHIISINKPGDFINLLTIFSDSAYAFSITALEDTYICEVELEVLKELILTNGNFALKILNRMSKIADSIIENSYEIHKKQMKGRVAYILVFLAKNIYRSNTLKLPITRREIGQLISMTTENVIRTLSEFRKDEIISIDNKTITILDFDRLQNIDKTG